ncbi:hypothetical protein BDZ91DRAFT_709978 [Kalaharituber pfeilii]|nr:hypothetical protein BDZ91DRAFT_709978 [Kalaharituber pfeilii]
MVGIGKGLVSLGNFEELYICERNVITRFEMWVGSDSRHVSSPVEVGYAGTRECRELLLQCCKLWKLLGKKHRYVDTYLNLKQIGWAKRYI